MFIAYDYCYMCDQLLYSACVFSLNFLVMKRSSNIASLFQKHAEKKAAAASNPLPDETLTEEQERVIEENVVHMPPPPPPPPPRPSPEPPPVYDINNLPHDPGERYSKLCC